MRFPHLPLGFLLPLLVVVWMAVHGLLDLWLFGSDPVVWRAIRLHLMVELGLLTCFMAALALVTYHRVTRRVRWLEEESGRIERGEPPRDALPGDDSIAHLSLAMRRMAARTRDFWQVINEHAMVTVTDGKGRITFANDQFCATSGYRREELLGNTHQLVNSGQHPPTFFKDLWRVIGSGEVWSGEIRNRCKNGTPFVVATTIVPCRIHGGDSPEHIAIQTDVTAFRDAEAGLLLLSEELKKRNADLNHFLHALTHDLRGPLLNVQGFAGEAALLTEKAAGLLQDAVQGNPPPPEQVSELSGGLSEAFRFISAGTTKMNALLNGLATISRLEQADARLEPVDAAAVLQESIAAMQFQIDQAEAVLTCGTLPFCQADRVLLGQVFYNLIENAVKYRDPGRPLRLSITGEQEGGKSVYRFMDNGVGIAPGDEEKIFGLFQRVDPARGSGLGLGLTLVRRAVDRMGGSIGVAAAPQGGTVFSVSLKAADPAANRSRTDQGGKKYCGAREINVLYDRKSNPVRTAGPILSGGISPPSLFQPHVT